MKARTTFPMLALALPFTLCAALSGAAPSLFSEMASQSGVAWMGKVQDTAPLSFGELRERQEVAETTLHEVVVQDPQSGLALRQTQQWLADPALCLLTTTATGEIPTTLPVNVVDWAFLFDDAIDGARFQRLTHSNDAWYGSTYWSGPDWTRVGRDWQHSGEHTSSVRRFTVPRDGSITVSGRVFKADTNGGDGIHASIRHNSHTVWGCDIDAADAQGADPALTLNVHAGDRLRFALHRRGAIACDTTHWDPVITYADGAVFRASEGFADNPRDGWSYEMEMEDAVGLPRVYTFDSQFSLHEQTLSPGEPIVLDHESSLPLFILADDRDAGGIAGAVLNACAWQIETSLTEDGRLSLRIRNDGGGDLPIVAAGAYRGNWLGGMSLLEKLRRSESTPLNLSAFRERIRDAFNAVLGRVDPKTACELDLWAAVQWDWHRQDGLTETAEGYEAAAEATVGKTEDLAKDLGVDYAPPLPQDAAPCLRYLGTHALRRRIALDNPLMKFGQLVFCKRVPPRTAIL